MVDAAAVGKLEWAREASARGGLADGAATWGTGDRKGVIRDRSFGPLDRAEMERRLATILSSSGATR